MHWISLIDHWFGMLSQFDEIRKMKETRSWLPSTQLVREEAPFIFALPDGSMIECVVCFEFEIVCKVPHAVMILAG